MKTYLNVLFGFMTLASLPMLFTQYAFAPIVLGIAWCYTHEEKHE